ncbi:MAG: LacI family DNA-binding transcriptional regulator [Thermomicrobiales bacterium]
MTIRAVASEAGVSISTVSNVVSGRHHQMKPETRERVLAAMAKLNYRPNRVARSLVTSRSATIGMVVGEITNSLYPPVTIGAEAACREAGYSLVLASASSADAERTCVELMRSQQVEALILFSISFRDAESDFLHQTDREGTPVVTLNRWLPDDSPLSAVWFDNRSGAWRATRHLIELGHRRIAHIAGPAHRLTGIQRRAGYEQALTETGLSIDSTLTKVGDYSFDSGEALMTEIWRERPTAVFVGGDVMALGAYRALVRLGVTVPGDVSLVAFGNPDAVRFSTPALTTIDLPVAAAGRAAVELALERIRTRDAKEVRTLQPALVVRETTGPPPVTLSAA